MNVILLEPLGGLGDIGDEVSVKAGFARNFLIPQGKAVRASAESRQVFEGRRAEFERTANEQLSAAQERASKLEGLSLTIVVKAGEEGKLYGSVGTQDIADKITAEAVEIAKSEVRLPAGVIRSTGDFEIDIQLHSDVTVSVALAVVPE
ncbi:MAG: 50S ribosomal protein L9 [Pseudomonadales bacterium]